MTLRNPIRTIAAYQEYVKKEVDLVPWTCKFPLAVNFLHVFPIWDKGIGMIWAVYLALHIKQYACFPSLSRDGKQAYRLICGFLFPFISFRFYFQNGTFLEHAS